MVDYTCVRYLYVGYGFGGYCVFGVKPHLEYEYYAGECVWIIPYEGNPAYDD